MKNSIRVTLMVLFFTWIGAGFAYSYTIPSGFSKIQSDTGVELYKNNSSSYYVQVINLSKGASIKLFHGTIANAGGNGSYCGNIPTFNRQSLNDAWNGLTTSYSNAFSITNGQFFATNDNPASLAFPLKKDGVVVSDGYGKNEFPNEKMALRIWSNYADIVSFDNTYGNVMCASSAPNIIVGLSETANKEPTNYVGRTFVGVLDDDSDGKNECVLIFNSIYARQTDAATILRNFGAKQIMMLDGGGSTQMICKGTSYISSSRAIPQTMAVLTTITKPTAPSGMSASALSSSSIKLTWSDSSDNETGFYVYRYDFVTSSWKKITTAGSNTTSFTDSGLSANTTYYYAVESYNSAGSSWLTSGYVYATTQSATTITKPIAPSSMSATVLSTSSIKLTWADSSSNETGFYVYRYDFGTGWKKITTAGSNATTYTDSGLSAATTYYYTVESYNSAGSSWLTQSPGYVYATTQAGSTTGGVYGRLRENSTTGAYLSGATVTCGGKTATTDSSGNYSLTGISAGSQTISFSKTGYQSYQKTVSITVGQNLNAGENYLVKNISKPTAPSGMSASALSSSSIKLAWSDSSDNETGFYVYRYDFGTGWKKITTAGSNTISYTDSGLNAGTTYYYTVESYNSAGSSWLTQSPGYVYATTQGNTNRAPIAESAVSKSSSGPYYGYNTPLTVTRGQSVTLYFFADKDVNGDGQASTDPDGWTDANNGVSSGGKIEWNTDLNQGMPTFEKSIANPVSAGSGNIGPYTYTFNDTPGTYEYQMLRITDRQGVQSNVSKIRVTVQESTGGVYGRLRETSTTGAYLSGATVTCGGKTATSDSSGSYSLTGISAGSQTVSFSKTGYQSYQKTVTITTGQNLNAGDNYLVRNYYITPSDYSYSLDQILLKTNISTLIFQMDGNLVLYVNGRAKWASGTDNKGAKRVCFQSDGNLVIYGDGNTVKWASNTAGKGVNKLILQDDCNLVMYNSSGKAVWATGTNCY